jgi:Zn-dependent peptidase ImmA (M78 family)/DNA-binding XRE family transcriptional regulator
MPSREPFDQQQVGRRIADARVEAELTQADLAQALGLDRSAVAKMEAGTRGVSAVELARISARLDRPLEWFLVESPPAIVSRRTDLAADLSLVLDRTLEKAASDVESLVQLHVLNPPANQIRLEPPRNLEDAKRAAEHVRSSLGGESGPLVGLDHIGEQLGLLCFSHSLGEHGGDGAYISLSDYGVTVINGDADPGRRRFTLAHEIGHHVFGDEYSADVSIFENGDEMERWLNAFAIHLLLPHSSIVNYWRTGKGETREKAIRIGADYRVSWSALCSQLRNLALVTDDERQALLRHPPRKAEYLELGAVVVGELQPPSVPPGYAQAVLRSLRSGKLGANRTVDLLWGSVTIEELPEPNPLPIDSLQREFDPLP